MHEFSDAGEASTDSTSGVEIGEVLGTPATASTYFEGEGVAEGKHDRGGGCRREVERAGFDGDAGVEMDVAGLGERGGGAPRESDERGGEALEGWDEAEELFGLTAVGEGQNRVAGGDHAHVAVDGLRGVEEVCGGTGGAEGGGDLAGDKTAFADAGDDDAVAVGGGCDEAVGGLGEGREQGIVEAMGQLVEGNGFDVDESGGPEGIVGRFGSLARHQ